MMKIILPLVIIILGAGIGGGAGYFLAPEPPEPETACACETAVETHADGDGHGGDGEGEAAEGEGEAAQFEYVNLPKQFVVPVIEDKEMTGMVVMSLALEVTPGSQETVFNREPKLRDEFLRLLFAYATIGGFAGNYLEANDLKLVRSDLTKAAQKQLGPIVNEVLIVDLVRQEI